MYTIKINYSNEQDIRVPHSVSIKPFMKVKGLGKVAKFS